MADFAADHGVICGVSALRRYGWVFRKQTAVPARRSAMAARTETPCVTDDPGGWYGCWRNPPRRKRRLYPSAAGNAPCGSQSRGGKSCWTRRRACCAVWQPAPDGAGAAHLHYNTVSYRLQQLWLLLEADPVDPMKRLALETALYLYRYRRTIKELLIMIRAGRAVNGSGWCRASLYAYRSGDCQAAPGGYAPRDRSTASRCGVPNHAASRWSA